jgi:hypothetical protein
MSKQFVMCRFLLLLVYLVFSTGLNLAQSDCKPCLIPNSNKLNLRPDVLSLDLGKDTLTLPCQYGKSMSNSCSDDSRISVKTVAVDPENDALVYSYIVSGGRIVGQGANVFWDLAGVRTGTYTITAAVDDGCGFCGKTITKTVTVRDCQDCLKVCNCLAGLTIKKTSLPTPIDETIGLTAEVNQEDVTFQWQLFDKDNNSIEFENQGGTIKIKSSPKLEGKTITARVEALGGCGVCETVNKSETFTILVQPRGNITGKVKLRGNSMFLNKAKVELFWKDTFVTSDETNADGSFSFSDILIPENRKPYTIRVTKDGYESNDTKTVLPTANITIELNKR